MFYMYINFGLKQFLIVLSRKKRTKSAKPEFRAGTGCPLIGLKLTVLFQNSDPSKIGLELTDSIIQQSTNYLLDFLHFSVKIPIA